MKKIHVVCIHPQSGLVVGRKYWIRGSAEELADTSKFQDIGAPLVDVLDRYGRRVTTVFRWRFGRALKKTAPKKAPARVRA